MSATGTIAEPIALLPYRAEGQRNLSIRTLRVCRTVPALATGTYRYPYPETLTGIAITRR